MAELDAIMETLYALPYDDQREAAKRLLSRHLDLLKNGGSGLDPIREYCAKERWKHYCDVLRAVTGEDITSRSRRRPVLEARWCAFVKMRQDGYSWKEMERASGWDHSTLMNAVSRVNDALDYPKMYPDFARVWNRMERGLAV